MPDNETHEKSVTEMHAAATETLEGLILQRDGLKAQIIGQRVVVRRLAKVMEDARLPVPAGNEGQGT